MKHRLPALFLLGGLGCSIFWGKPAKTPIEDFKSPLAGYIDLLRIQSVDPAATRFALTCQISLNEVHPRFAFSNNDEGTWRVVQGLPQAYDNIEMDLIGTAEVWKTARGTFVEEWDAALDVGGFARTMYCFDVKGELDALDAANHQFPTDNGTPWGMHEQWTRKTDGSFVATIPFHFIGLKDQSVLPPKLDEDNESFAQSWGKKPPRLRMISELKLPSVLFQ